MKNQIQQLTKETSEALIASITSASIKGLIEKTKAASDTDSGSFKIVVSTSDVDRQGESVNQNGWDLTFYKMNPIVLWAHDYSALPIGMCTSIEVQDNKLVAEGKFAPSEANPFAQQVRKLYDLGMVNTTSVGFIPKEYDGKKDGVINKSELLEFSFVPVPANPMALRLDEIRLNGFDTELLKTKGLDILVKEEPAPVETPVAPVEEKPKDEEKGIVSDTLNQAEVYEAKWEKYCDVAEAFDAFCTVLFSETTPLDDFPKLVSELGDILKSLASGGGEDESGMKAKIDALLKGQKPLTIKDATMAIARNHLALGSFKLPDGKEAEKSINTPALEEVNEFVETRELLRSIDRVVEKALTKFNLAARDRKPV